MLAFEVNSSLLNIRHYSRYLSGYSAMRSRFSLGSNNPRRGPHTRSLMLIETRAAIIDWFSPGIPIQHGEPVEVEMRSATMPRTPMCPSCPVAWFSWRRITALPARAGQVRPWANALAKKEETTRRPDLRHAPMHCA